MKPDYKNWVPKGMVYGLAGGTLAAFAAFLILGATGIILHGTPRLVCGIVFGIGTLVLLFFTVWMGALHKTFDYNGKRKLAKTIIDGTARMSGHPVRKRAVKRCRQRLLQHNAMISLKNCRTVWIRSSGRKGLICPAVNSSVWRWQELNHRRNSSLNHHKYRRQHTAEQI